jgi:hypothetical protein
MYANLWKLQATATIATRVLLPSSCTVAPKALPLEVFAACANSGTRNLQQADGWDMQRLEVLLFKRSY